MIRIFLILILCTSTAFSADKTPDSKNGFETGIDLRAIKKKRRFLILAESKNRKELTGHDYNQVMAGTYYRITKRFRTGLFFQGEQGLRWDEDWKKIGSNWDWQDMNDRWDFSSVVDFTYNDRWKKNFVWEMKSRFYYYHSRDSLQLRLRPGLRYFILEHARPKWQLFTEFEAYVPLNYGTVSLYEYWLYVGGLYQVTNRFALGPVVSLRERWFHAYDGFEKKSGTTYRASYESIYLGLNLLYQW